MMLILAPIFLVIGCSTDGDPIALQAFDVQTDSGPVNGSELAAGTASVDAAISKPVSPKNQVVENCRIVQAAVEAWAADNGGLYPWSSSHANALGYTFYDYLPVGQLLVNPFTFARTEPVYGAAAQQGQTGYLPISCGGQAMGYVITGVTHGFVTSVVIERRCDGTISESIGSGTR